MPWSTRDIAELAGTSLRAVRHYHHIGLLDEPDRLSNGEALTHLYNPAQVDVMGRLGRLLAEPERTE
ncbi:MerR family DNA-binding transcriptional regulator [Streptomyces sp. NPDC057695]|uniref:MerR family transcriptional regulator n=1 Tax=Streptomyces sp. NPDC057695 TaxID=3346217 RepID=UPI003679CCBB